MGNTQEEREQPGGRELPATVAALRELHTVLSTREVIFAVVWQDFGVPFTLHCKDQADAIETTKSINHRRAILQPDLPHEARARPLLLEADDTIIWLDGEGAPDESDADGDAL